MNIQTYRRKFILIAMSAMTACLVLLLLLINVFNGYRMIAEQQDILSILSENNGMIPDFNSPMAKRRPPRGYQITEESAHLIRYFHVTIDPEGRMVSADLQHIAAVGEEDAAALAAQAAAMEQEYGFIDYFMFKAYTREGGVHTHYLFLDGQEKIAAAESFALISAFMGAIGLGVTFLIVLWLSQKAIRPVIVSTQKQQQFITDASHELKTPLSAISVNMEVLAIEMGENEWISSTNEQIRMLRQLVDQLITSARLDEEASLYGEKKMLDLCEIVSDAVTCFAPMAEAAGRTIELDMPEHFEMLGNEELLRRLISVLCDNAVKHASGKGNIKLYLSSKGKNVVLRIQNPWPAAKDNSVYARMLDRFYKVDPARSKDAAHNGFGVGLSIAEKAAQWHGGTIKASPVGTDQICFTVTLRSK